MKTFIIACSLCIGLQTRSQDIVNIVLVGNKGVTDNIKEANAFIVVKKYPDCYQRIDYKLHAPVQKIRSYSDSTLTVLQGNYYEYADNGAIFKSGFYQQNQKEGDWYLYNDTGKVVLEEKYIAGVLTKTINPDTVKKGLEKETLYGDEREACYKKDEREWIKYLMKNLNADVGAQSVAGGQVRVMFVVNTQGKCVDVHLKKSVEFVLDEEAIRIIEQSPLWQPAFQNGKAVNAYRVQPVTFAKE